MTALGQPASASSSIAERRADLAGGAVAALEAVVLEEGLLQRVQLVAVGQALDGGDLGAVGGDREHQAGVDAAAVEQDGAGAALAVVAALLGAGQIEVLAQGVEQGGAVVDVERGASSPLIRSAISAIRPHATRPRRAA